MSDQPTHIGNYRIERELFRDEHRIIYQGWQTSLSKPVMITLLTPQATQDKAFVDRWKQAARGLRGHPHINNILDGAFSGEPIYLVERYLVADSLSQRLQEPWQLVESGKLWYEWADALGYAHQKGWAAGTMTADNIRILDNKTSYLMDLPWLAAQREPEDAEAMKADVEAVTQYFMQMCQSQKKEPPSLIGNEDADVQALSEWLIQGDAADAQTRALVEAVAPVLLRALQGDFTTADPLAEALKPLVRRRKTTGGRIRETTDRTIMQPPPGSTPPPSTQAQTPPPPLSRPPQGTPPLPPSPKSRRGWLWPGVVAGVLAIVIIGAAILCWQGVVPFCASCDESLIREYVRAAESFADRESWPEAAREVDSALQECSQCGKEVEACTQAETLQSPIQCQAKTERLVTDAQTLLNAGDACAAVEALEQAIVLDCETQIAEALLAGGKQGGAYLQCTQSYLEDPTPERCDSAHAYLAKAHELKPTNLEITASYDKATTYATLQKAFAAEQWDDAQTALDTVLTLIPEGAYCGESLQTYRYDILMGQGEQREPDHPCEAVTFYQEAKKVAETMAQKNEVEDVLAQSQKDCRDTWTPTPTPTDTPTPSPTPTPTPQPVAEITKPSANIRQGPNIRHPKVATAKKGERFDVICNTKQSDGVWYDVQLPEGDGWIREDLVSVYNSRYTTTCTIIPPEPVVHYCWRSRIEGIDKLEFGRVELLVSVKDANNRSKAGVRIHVINPYGGVTLGDHDTDINGVTTWAAVTPIKWKICIAPEKACIVTPYEEQDQSIGIRIRVAFKLDVCN